MGTIVPAIAASLVSSVAICAELPSSVLCSQEAKAAAATSADIDAVIRTFERTWWGERPDIDELQKIATTELDTLEINSLSGVDLGRLMTFTQMLAHAQRIPEVREALARFNDDPGPDGASARVHLLSSRLWSAHQDEEQVAILREVLTHPGLDQAVKAGAVNNLFARFRGARPEVLKACADELLSLKRFLTPEHASHLSFGFQEYHQMLQAAIGEERGDDLEAVRVRMAQLAKGAAASHSSDRAAKIARDAASYLEGPFVRGTLIGGPAPAMTIIWSSDPGITSLASLKGRVVVLDFWATWCGPCIASFPQIRELTAHYEGYPVTVLGVTSPQGFHIVEPRNRIHTEGDRQREFDLMAEYIPSRDITWPVVFTEENVFHPGYGVRGIPHVAIIDPAGKVRYNGLHPSLPQGRSLYEKSEKINALLREAGLSSPPPLSDPDESTKASSAGAD